MLENTKVRTPPFPFLTLLGPSFPMFSSQTLEATCIKRLIYQIFLINLTSPSNIYSLSWSTRLCKDNSSHMPQHTSEGQPPKGLIELDNSPCYPSQNRRTSKHGELGFSSDIGYPAPIIYKAGALSIFALWLSRIGSPCSDSWSFL